MDYRTLSTPDLTAAYNEAFGKSVKPGSYPRAKLIGALEEAAAATTPAADPITFEEVPGGVDYPAPAPTTEDEVEPSQELIQERLQAHACPFCGGDPSNQTAAGLEGTFLGDSCNECHDCGRSYNVYTGEQIVAVAQTGGKKKRRILNPQSKIDAKVDAAKAAGFDLFYDRPSRVWTVTLTEDASLIMHLASRDFAEYTPAELVALCQYKAAQA